jgi:Domain of unknown function (DUF1833)
MPVQPQNIPAALATSSNVVWLALLTISIAGYPSLYVVNNSAPIVSRGVQYEPYPFNLTLPADDSESLPSVSLVLSNLDKAIVEFVRSQMTPPTIVIEIVTSAYPDIVEKSLSFLKLVSVTYDAMQLTGTLNVDDFMTQGFPAESYVPPQFPALFL